jgi:hypothetical protein
MSLAKFRPSQRVTNYIEALRLDAATTKTQETKTAPRCYAGACIECGNAYTALTREAEFCGKACRQAFNNRRMTRGAFMYDLIMAMRFDRPLAKQFKVWVMLCRMAADFRKEDVEARAGRKSWRHPKIVLSRHTHLHSVTLVSSRKGRA